MTDRIPCQNLRMTSSWRDHRFASGCCWMTLCLFVRPLPHSHNASKAARSAQHAGVAPKAQYKKDGEVSNGASASFSYML